MALPLLLCSWEKVWARIHWLSLFQVSKFGMSQFALCCYTFGLIWIRALMRQDDMKGAM